MSNKWFWGLLILFLVGGLSAGLLYRRYRLLKEQSQTQVHGPAAQNFGSPVEYLNKLNGLQRKVYGFVSRLGDSSSEATEGYLIFISSGEVEKKEIVAKDTDEVAEIYTITGVSKDAQGNPINVEIAVQAVLRNEGENIFSFLLEKFVNDRGLGFEVDKETLVSEERLRQVFSPGTTIWASFWILPLDLNNPLLDPGGSWVKLHKLAEKTENIDINNLNEFINSGLRIGYKKIIIPSSYAFLDNP